MTSINPHGNFLAASSAAATSTAATSAQAAKSPANSAKAEAKEMAADFEAIFVRQMLSTMRTASLGKGLFDGQGSEEFRDMQDSMLAENMADKGVFGIAELLTRHLDKTGAAANTAPHDGASQNGGEKK